MAGVILAPFTIRTRNGFRFNMDAKSINDGNMPGVLCSAYSFVISQKSHPLQINSCAWCIPGCMLVINDPFSQTVYLPLCSIMTGSVKFFLLLAMISFMGLC